MTAFAVLLFSSFAQVEAPHAEEGSHDRDIVLEIGSNDPMIEGHGHSKSVEHTADFEGDLYAWVQSPTGLDTILRVDASNGRRYEDDDSGGKPNPCLCLLVARGSKIVLTVMASKPHELGTVELHLRAAPETAATLEVAAKAKEELAAIKKLREAHDFDAAIPRINAVADSLLNVDGGATSGAIDDQAANAADEYYQMNVLQPTDQLRRFVVAYRMRMMPADHYRLLVAQSNLAVLLRNMGEVSESRAILQHVLESVRRTLPESERIYQGTLLNLAGSTGVCGDLVTAGRLQQELLDIRLRLLPPDCEAVQEARGALAATMHEMGDLEGARAIQEQVVRIMAKSMREEDRDRLVEEMNLANTLQSLGDLVRARDLKRHVVDVQSRALAPDSVDLQLSRANLAGCIYLLGDVDSALVLLDSAQRALQGVVAPDHRAVLVTKSNLATILADKGDLERAASIFEDLVTLLANGNKEFRELQRDRFNLANTYVKLGRIEEAREVAQAAVDGFSRALPADYPDRITAQETLSQIAICQGDFESARRIDTEVLAARARILPKNHPDLQKAQLNLAQLLAIQKRVAEDTGESATAIDDSDFTALVAAAVAGLESHVRSAILASSRRETEALCANRGDQLDRVLSMALGLQVFPDCGTLERGAFELSEMVRGAALTSARLRRHSQNSAAAVELRTRLIAASTEIARLSQSGASIDAIHAAVTSRDEAEQELIALAGPDDAAVTMRPDAEALAARLPKFTAIVAFRSYSHTIIPKGARGSKGRQDLCAFVLRRSPDGTGCVMNRVELGPIELFERAVHAWRDAIGATVERSMAPGAKALDDENAAADAELLRGRELRKLLLDPLLPVLGDANHLVVVFDDVLHLVALDALPLDLPEKPDPAAPALVGEKWRVEVRSTLSELLHEPPSTAGSNLLVAFGGATYNSEPIAPDDQDSTKVAAVPPPTAGAEILRGGTWERGFRPLPNTGPESHGVGDLFEEHFGDQGTSRILDGKRASREALVELAPRARWLHVATHGWFAPDSVRSWSDARPSGPEIDGLLRLDRADWVRGMSPMLLSGLALAGANLQADAVGRVPGLVTAEELSALDLGNCELAVLSACDTNVGDRRAGQGVASLQKALQMAGARSVITSLWKVPDDATLDLMLDFYQRLWVRKEPKWQALWEAKLMLRAKHDDVGRPLHSTRDWAGWVLTGEPE